jgi:hypothetical protein
MLKQIILRLAETAYFRKIIEAPPDLGIFREKPSPRFFAGLGVMAISYAIGWPLIAILGGMAFHFREPLIFTVGSPITYGFSHLVFMTGVWIAGPDSIKYMKVFLRWSVARGFHRILGNELIKPGKDSDG